MAKEPPVLTLTPRMFLKFYIPLLIIVGVCMVAGWSSWQVLVAGSVVFFLVSAIFVSRSRG